VSDFDPLNIRQPKPKQGPAPIRPNGFGSFLQNVALIAALCFAAVTIYDRYQPDDGDREKDREEQVEPTPTPDEKPASIVFVRELKDAPIDQALLMREVRELGIDFRDLDDDLPESEKYLQYGLTKGVQPPLVVLQDKSNRPYAVYSWPTIEQIRMWVK
jgi:hypothetical protein